MKWYWLLILGGVLTETARLLYVYRAKWLPWAKKEEQALADRIHKP